MALTVSGAERVQTVGNGVYSGNDIRFRFTGGRYKLVFDGADRHLRGRQRQVRVGDGSSTTAVLGRRRQAQLDQSTAVLELSAA